MFGHVLRFPSDFQVIQHPNYFKLGRDNNQQTIQYAKQDPSAISPRVPNSWPQKS